MIYYKYFPYSKIKEILKFEGLMLFGSLEYSAIKLFYFKKNSKQVKTDFC
jgi:hypothetical protein